MKKFISIFCIIILSLSLFTACNNTPLDYDDEPPFVDVWQIVVSDNVYTTKISLTLGELIDISEASYLDFVSENNYFGGINVHYETIPNLIDAIVVQRDKTSIFTVHNINHVIFYQQTFSNGYVRITINLAPINSIDIIAPSVRIIDNVIEVCYRGELHTYTNAEFRLYHFTDLENE